MRGKEETAKMWGVGRRVVWISLALPYLLSLRASELSAEDDSRVYAAHCVRGRVANGRR